MERLSVILSCPFILTVLYFDRVGACVPVPFGSPSKPVGDSPSWTGCVAKCRPQDFRGEIHVLKQHSGDDSNGNTIVNVVPRSELPVPGKLILILVSIKPTVWVVVPGENVQISRIFMVSGPTGYSSAIVHQQVVEKQSYSVHNPSVSTRGILLEIGPLPIYITSLALTTSTKEWSLPVGLKRATKLCPRGIDPTGPSQPSSYFTIMIKRALGIVGFVLVIFIIIGLACWWKRRKAKGALRRSRTTEFLPPPTIVATTDVPPEVPYTPPEAAVPPPYSPYVPPPSYETVEPKPSRKMSKGGRRSRSKQNKPGPPPATGLP